MLPLVSKFATTKKTLQFINETLRTRNLRNPSPPALNLGYLLDTASIESNTIDPDDLYNIMREGVFKAINIRKFAIYSSDNDGGNNGQVIEQLLYDIDSDYACLLKRAFEIGFTTHKTVVCRKMRQLLTTMPQCMEVIESVHD